MYYSTKHDSPEISLEVAAEAIKTTIIKEGQTFAVNIVATLKTNFQIK